MRDAGRSRYEEAAIHTEEMRMLAHIAPNAALKHWSSVMRPADPSGHLTTSCKTDMRTTEFCFLELHQSFLELCMDANSNSWMGDLRTRVRMITFPSSPG